MLKKKKRPKQTKIKEKLVIFKNKTKPELIIKQWKQSSLKIKDNHYGICYFQCE